MFGDGDGDDRLVDERHRDREDHRGQHPVAALQAVPAHRFLPLRSLRWADYSSAPGPASEPASAPAPPGRARRRTVPSGTDLEGGQEPVQRGARAAGRWLLRTRCGSEARSPSSSLAKRPRSTLCSHGESTVAQKTWPWCSSSSERSSARSGTSARSAPKQSAAEQGAGPVVVEAGRDRVVERRRLDRREGAVAHGDRLAGVEQVHPVHRQRRRQAHDAHPEEGGDDAQPRVLGQQAVQRADVVEVRVREPDPPQVGRDR